MTAKAKPKQKPRPKPKPPPDDPGFELKHVGEWTDEHTKVIGQLLVDLEEDREAELRRK